jgi:Domain of unknown function (DUF4232)
VRPLIILALLTLTACTTPTPLPGPTPPPSTSTPQPQTGLVISPGEVEAASGLRAMTLTATNQDTTPHALNGYPALRLLDDDHQPLQVRIVPGATGITTGFDTPPQPITLEPGQKATASVLWRNTVTDATVKATRGTYLDTAPTAGEPWQTLQPVGGLDIGNTGTLGVSPWAVRTTP